MKEPERGKHVPILGNDFGMKAQLVINQKGPSVYFWDELKQCLAQTDPATNRPAANDAVKEIQEILKMQLQILAEDEDTGEDDCLIEDADTGEEDCLIAKVFEDVVIPPMTQMCIELQHPVTHKNRSDRLIEGLPTLVAEKGVKLANGIVTPKATSRFQAILGNLGNENICLK